jgi:hypothetical protein
VTKLQTTTFLKISGELKLYGGERMKYDDGSRDVYEVRVERKPYPLGPLDNEREVEDEYLKIRVDED